MNEPRTRTERRVLVDAIKIERGCEEPTCAGYPRDPRALHFDHVRGSKTFEVSQAVDSLRVMGGTSRPGTRPMKGDVFERTTWAAILEEIAKCDVVCANCHAVRTGSRPKAPTLSNRVPS